MKRQKTVNDVRGAKIQCVNYIKCPICYGCRHYNALDPECQICAQDKKLNICTNKLHRPDLMDRMILKSKIKIDKAEFKNWGTYSNDESDFE